MIVVKAYIFKDVIMKDTDIDDRVCSHCKHEIDIDSTHTRIAFISEEYDTVLKYHVGCYDKVKSVIGISEFN